MMIAVGAPLVGARRRLTKIIAGHPQGMPLQLLKSTGVKEKHPHHPATNGRTVNAQSSPSVYRGSTRRGEGVKEKKYLRL